MHTETEKSTTAYVLPGGRVVAVHADAAHGAVAIRYELAPGRIVDAVRADLHGSIRHCSECGVLVFGAAICIAHR